LRHIPDEYLSLFESKLETICLFRKNEVKNVAPSESNMGQTAIVSTQRQVSTVVGIVDILKRDTKIVAAMEYVSVKVERGSEIAAQGITKGTQLLVGGMER
jgi:hypothetical protein